MARADEEWETVAVLVELEFDERSKTVITVNRNLRDGHLNIDVRVYWSRKGDYTWYPSKRGITLSLDDWEVAVAVIQAWLDDYRDNQ